jgi:hypothetical protein
MPNEWIGVLIELMLWGWIIATVGFIYFSFPRRGVFLAATAFRWGGGALLFFAAWVAAMTLG